MLNARAYTLRQKSRLAISLSWIAGFTNVVALLVTAQMVSHTTGNVTHLAQALIELQWRQAWVYFAIVVMFILGAAMSGASVQWAIRSHRRSIYIVPMALQATLLSLVGVAVSVSVSMDMKVTGETLDRTVLMAILCLGSMAMGLQNATITEISAAAVRTTHLTGVLTDIGTSAVSLSIWLWKKLRGRPEWTRWRRVMRGLRRQPDAAKLALLVSVFGSFVIGAMFGAAAHHWVPRWSMLLPVTFLLWIIVVDWRQPIADLKEVDHVGDAELKRQGISPEMIPAGVQIFRVEPRQANLPHHAPDFAAWAADLPREAHVCVLCLAPTVLLDAGACYALGDVARQLNAQGRHLLLANARSQEYDALNRTGVIDAVGAENLCSDLEFAIARATTIWAEENRFN
jgi:uncharacterized membrane protein YoaK (UPF0700 family)